MARCLKVLAALPGDLGFDSLSISTSVTADTGSTTPSLASKPAMRHAKWYLDTRRQNTYTH